MKKFLSILYISTSLLLLIGCTQVADDSALELENSAVKSGEGLQVVTTIAPLYSLTLNLVEGTDVKVTNVVPINASGHTFQLTPQAMKDLNDADLVVSNGLGMEMFLEDVMEELKGTVLSTSDLVVERYELEEDDDHEDEEGEGADDDHEDEDDGHGHDGVDPHVWLSPIYAKVQAEAIYDSLVMLDGANEGIYSANLEKLLADLDALDKEIAEGLQAVEAMPYIVFHEAYHYFEDRYGLEAAAAVQEFPGKEPSASYMANLVDVIAENNVRVIFTEPQFSPKLVQTLTEDYGLVVLQLDPLGAELSKDSYFKMMRSNLESFMLAFSFNSSL
ncbi:zinc ABC transporter substrate-binding protein [Candidatus Peregrinibacteria bacterium HGW-Peregrinibacteria-1]|jgi:zinc transport system substrate-binding protein|nr:MAG: zinc ABC transporter substrate-binding protein [Candidatus Peregrinibacteria bacterium HGW-Peregrinibacteria-1]